MADPAVADAVKAVIDGLALSPTPSVVKRKRLWVLDGDAFPLVAVAVADGVGSEVLGRQTETTRRVIKTYPTWVMLVFKNRGLMRENATLRAWLDAIDTAMLNWNTGLAVLGLPGVNEVASHGQAVFDEPALSLGYDKAVLGYSIQVAQDV